MTGSGSFTPQVTIDHSGNMGVVGVVTALTFVPTSDRNAKENFVPVDPREVLDKVAALPISRWNFKQDRESAHVGPMAKDFRAAFGLGSDDKHIATVDADGVALAAIQGLNQKVEEQRRENAALKSELADNQGRRNAEVTELKARNAAMERRLEKLERLLSGRGIGGAP